MWTLSMRGVPPSWSVTTGVSSSRRGWSQSALESIEHDGTLGKIYFPYGTKKDPSVDGHGDEWWHQWPDVALTVIQYQEEGQSSVDAPIVWPDAYKTGDPVYVNQ